ncbi:hypothetical protein D3C81_2180760 [compost metagenome]
MSGLYAQPVASSRMERNETFSVSIVLESLPVVVVFMTFTPSRKPFWYFGVKPVCCSSNDSARWFDAVVVIDPVRLD